MTVRLLLYSLLCPAIMLTSANANDSLPQKSKKVAVFVHGAGGGGWEWHTWVPVFASGGWVCINPSLMPSGKGIGATRFDDYLQQVIHWARGQQPCTLVLVGASMGGILTLKATEELHPAAIVLVNSVGPAGIGKRKAHVQPEVIRWSWGSVKETQDSMPDSDAQSIFFAFKHWRDESGAVLNQISKGIQVHPPKCPVLVVLGDKDTDVPNSVGKEMAKRYHADLKVYKGMSHVGPLLGTRASQVAQDTSDWLDKHIR